MKTSHYHNPYHSISAQADNEAGALLTLRQGVEREFNDLLALELAAEQLAEDEADLLSAYLAEDIDRSFSR